jgi:beta-glucosidase
MKKAPVLLCCMFLLTTLNVWSSERPTYMDPIKSLKEKVEDALSRMTLEEKIAMCHAQSKS